MYEVEVKVAAAHDAVRQRLDALDAESRGRVTQTDTYYDAPHRDFAETDEALRVRVEQRDAGAAADTNGAADRVAVTYKGPLVETASKTREEAETEVADEAAFRRILAGLGFDPAATVRKTRERYDYRGYAVTLDAVADLGEFVEVETETDGDVAAAREGALDVLRDLGLDPADQIRTSYLGLLLGDESK